MWSSPELPVWWVHLCPRKTLSVPRGTRIRPELPHVGSVVAMGPQLIVTGLAVPGRRRLGSLLLDRAVESGRPLTLQSPARSWGV